MVSLAPQIEPIGSVLLSYLTRPFLAAGGAEADAHTNVWECRQIAQTFLDLGYAVDVIDWNNTRFRPRKPYRFLVDICATIWSGSLRWSARIYARSCTPPASTGCFRIGPNTSGWRG